MVAHYLIAFRSIMGQETEQTRIRDLLKDNPKGLTIEEVSQKLSLNRATAAKYLNSMMMSGQAELRELGRAKIFYLSQRLPLINLLSLSSDLILVLDRDHFIQEVNERFLSFFHQTKDELKGKRIEHSGIAPHFTKNDLESLEQALDGSEVSYDAHIEIEGDDRYFRMKFIPLVFDGGNHAAGIILEDISEMKRYQIELEERIHERTIKLENEVRQHKQAEDALRKNDAVLRSMLDATPVGVALLVNREFKKVNNSLCDITGYSAEELTGHDTRILFIDDSEYLRIGQDLYKSQTGHTVEMLESRFRKKDGSIIDVMLNLSPFDTDNPDTGVTATIVDITERKRSEEALKRANNQVAILTSITRHDILNKLTALRGYIRYMRKQTHDTSLIEIIQKEEDLAVMIANLINFTRDFKFVGIAPPEWIDVADTVAALQKTMKLEPVSLLVNVGNLQIFADPLIRKVFTNLIENSLRHGGPVTEIRISTVEKGDHLIIIYEDNGVGIPDDEKELIFEREYRRNSGFGLFLAREILAITTMTIAETGQAGSGVRFEIAVPKPAYRFNDQH